jgi:hypothetical protein
MKGKQLNVMAKRLTLATMITASLGLISVHNSVAMADEHSSADHGSSDHGQHKGTGGKRGEGKGADGRGGADSVRGKILSTMDDDSDAPAWARGNRELNPHSKGSQGKPEGGGTKKGDEYGDLWVILRDNNGDPILDANGQVQPIIIVDGLPVVVQLTDPDGDGHYELPTEYTDAVQEVELGRSNVTRSPSQVILHSLEEALSKLDGMTLTSDMLTEAGMLVVDGATIDSPLENLALYQALLTSSDANDDGMLEVSVDYSGESGSGTYTFLVPESVQLDLAASLLAAGSDKTAALTVDRVVTVSQFLDVDDELSTLLNSYVYDGSSITYGATTTWINVQVDGMDTPTDLSDDIYQTVEVNLVTGTTITYNGDEIVVPGVSFVAVPNTVDENDDGVLDSNDTGDFDGIDGFTQAADDALQVIEYVHDYSVGE